MERRLKETIAQIEEVWCERGGRSSGLALLDLRSHRRSSLNKHVDGLEVCMIRNRLS